MDMKKSLFATLTNLGKLDGVALYQQLNQLTDSSGSMAVLVHVQAQNAGLVLTRQGLEILIEAFELSPHSDAVYEGAEQLRRSFLGHATKLDIEDFRHGSRPNLKATTIAQMATHEAPGMPPVTTKSSARNSEPRATVDPSVVTDLLLTVFSALGKRDGIEEFETIIKNTREDVMWAQALLPFRRSPLVPLYLRAGSNLTMMSRPQGQSRQP